jgi:hypothetical protein
MITLDEFRTGQISLPVTDADDLPPCCFTCTYLLYKEFSVCSCDGPCYVYCGYGYEDKITRSLPPCLEDTPS